MHTIPLKTMGDSRSMELYRNSNYRKHLITVEPRLNEPLHNEVLGITNDFLHGQNYSIMYGTEPRFNEILVITNTIQKRNHKIYFDITNKCEHVIKK